jgi:hypothetical protein
MGNVTGSIPPGAPLINGGASIKHSVALVSGMRCDAAPPVVPSLEGPLVEHWRIGKTVKEVRKKRPPRCRNGKQRRAR